MHVTFQHLPPCHRLLSVNCIFADKLLLHNRQLDRPHPYSHEHKAHPSRDDIVQRVNASWILEFELQGIVEPDFHADSLGRGRRAALDRLHVKP